MPALADIMRAGRLVEGHRPWPRVVVDEAGWRAAAGLLAEAKRTLLGLWGDAAAVHLAFLDERAADIAVVTLECPEGRFPSVGLLHPAAIRLERAIHDLW